MEVPTLRQRGGLDGWPRAPTHPCPRRHMPPTPDSAATRLPHPDRRHPCAARRRASLAFVNVTRCSPNVVRLGLGRRTRPPQAAAREVLGRTGNGQAAVASQGLRRGSRDGDSFQLRCDPAVVTLR